MKRLQEITVVWHSVNLVKNAWEQEAAQAGKLIPETCFSAMNN